MTKEQIRAWYGHGITDAQLDGMGTSEDSPYKRRNFVALGIITQEEVDAIRATQSIEPLDLIEQMVAMQAQIAQIQIDGGMINV